MELIRSFLLLIRSAISQLPDLFVSAVIPEEEEPRPEDRNEVDDLEVYRCPVFMNRVSFDVFFSWSCTSMRVPFSFLSSSSAIGCQGCTRGHKMLNNFPIPDIDVSYLSASSNQVILNVCALKIWHIF